MTAHFTQLFALLYQQGKLEQLSSALSQARDRMVATGEEDLWRYWNSLALAANGKFDAAESEAARLTSERGSEARRAIILERTRQTKDYDAAAEFFLKQWNESKSPPDLLTLCELQLQAGKPQFVVEHAKDLIAVVGTAGALRLVINAAARQQSWHLCLQLLDENAEMFPNSELPSDLRRLRISCYQAVGLLDEARNEAEALVREEANTQNLSLLFHVHVQAGNLKDACLPARKLVRAPDTSPELLVEVARVMRLEDPTVASEALRQAVERDVQGPQPVGVAATVALQLNEDSLLPVLFRKMAEEAKRGTPLLRTASLDEILEFKRASDERSRFALDQWRSGKVPVHCLRPVLNVPLAAWPVLALHEAPSDGSLSKQLAVFFRHGGRPATPSSRDIKRLYVDLTALHLSYQLGILPLVEEVFGPLYLPPAARLSLVAQADEAQRSQPDVVEAQTIVAEHLDGGRIQVWAPPPHDSSGMSEKEGLAAEWWQALAVMQQRNGLLVDYWPKLRHTTTPFAPSPEMSQNVTSVPSVLKALSALGSIELEQAEHARERLRSFDTSGFDFPVPEPRQLLFLEGNIAEQLAASGLLDAAVRTFQIMMGSTDVFRLRQDIIRAKHWLTLCKHLEVLRDRVTASPNYAQFALRQTSYPETPEKPLDAAEIAIMQLIQAEATDGAFAWIDDRCLNAHSRCGEIPIITTLGVIEELKRRNKINTVRYHALRHRLRAADFRYMPLIADEIAHHVLNAPISNNQIVETPELSVLRRYHARTLLDNSALQIPPLDFETPNPSGESNVLISASIAVSEALVTIFSNHNTETSKKFAQADWILHELWLEPAHFRSMVERPEIPGAQHADAQGLGDFMLLTKTISKAALNGDNNRNLYFEWLESRVLTNTQRTAAVAANVRKILEHGSWRKPKNAQERRVYTAVMQDWYLALPQRLRKAIKLTKATRDRLFIGRKRAISIGDAQFAPREFWRAAEQAVAGKESKLRALNEGPEFTLKFVERDGAPVLLAQQDGVEPPSGLEDPIWGVLKAKSSERLLVMKKHPEWFDAAGPNAVTKMVRIAKMRQSDSRAEAIDRARAKSAWNHYLGLGKKCLSGQGPTLEEMAPPPASDLKTFLRLPHTLTSARAKDTFEKCAAVLIEEVGLQEAFYRLAMLPLDLPEQIIAVFGTLSSTEASSFIGKIKNNIHTPLARIHYLNLLLSRGRDFQSAAVEIIGELLDPKQIVETGSFLASINWAWNQLAQEEQIDSIFRLILAWVHGSVLFGLLRQISSASDIQQFAKQYGRYQPGESIVSVPGDADVSFPRRMSPIVFMISGIGAILSRTNTQSEKLDASISLRVRELCFMPQGENQVPKPEWLTDQTIRPNALQSFLGKPRVTIMTPLIGADLAEQFSEERVLREIEAVIESLEKDDQQDQHSSWILLTVLLGSQICPPSIRERLEVILNEATWDSFGESDAIRGAVLAAIATLAWSVGGDELVKVFQQRITKVARLLSLQPGDVGSTQQEKLNIILVAIEALARYASREKSAKVFSETLVMCFNEWPDLANAIPGALTQMLQLPAAQMKETWKVILRLRHDAHPERARAEKVPMNPPEGVSSS
jgi:hypothetical protein